jgi:hypothetical protein
MADNKSTKEITNEEVTTVETSLNIIESDTTEVLDNDQFIVRNEDIASSFYCDGSELLYPEYKKDGVTKSKLAGKSYWIITFNGKAFTTRDRRFVEALAINDLYSVKMKKDGDYLSLVNFTPASAKLNHQNLMNQIGNSEDERRERQAISLKRISYINSINLKDVVPDEDLVKSLMAAV